MNKLSWKTTEINSRKADFGGAKKERKTASDFVSMSQGNLKLCVYSPYLWDIFHLILWKPAYKGVEKAGARVNVMYKSAHSSWRQL